VQTASQILGIVVTLGLVLTAYVVGARWPARQIWIIMGVTIALLIAENILAFA
jgi:hypothetical protein